MGPAPKEVQSSQFHGSEWSWMSKVVCPGTRFPREFTEEHQRSSKGLCGGREEDPGERRNRTGSGTVR